MHTSIRKLIYQPHSNPTRLSVVCDILLSALVREGSNNAQEAINRAEWVAKGEMERGQS